MAEVVRAKQVLSWKYQDGLWHCDQDPNQKIEVETSDDTFSDSEFVWIRYAVASDPHRCSEKFACTTLEAAASIPALPFVPFYSGYVVHSWTHHVFSYHKLMNAAIRKFDSLTKKYKRAGEVDDFQMCHFDLTTERRLLILGGGREPKPRAIKYLEG